MLGISPYINVDKSGKLINKKETNALFERLTLYSFPNCFEIKIIPNQS